MDSSVALNRQQAISRTNKGPFGSLNTTFINIVSKIQIFVSERYLQDMCANIHCVTTEKVPAKYRSLKMADASLGKCSIFVDWGGIAWTRQRLSMHMGRKSA